MNRVQSWPRPIRLWGLHVVVMVVAYVVALSVRLESQIPERFWDSFGRFLPAMVALAVLVHVELDAYSEHRGPSRIVIAGLLTMVVSPFVARWAAIPLTVAVVGSLASSIALGVASRLRVP
jgi:hypothetical protein